MENTETSTTITLPWEREITDTDNNTEPLSLDEIREVIKEIRY